jgi:hypothetical protein
MQHLYVMQNHLGLIKVGRSKNVEARRRRLEVADNCDIEIVALIEGCGEFEDGFHTLLRRHCLYGEWYDGDDKARKAIARLTGLSRTVKWPFALSDNDTICDWLDELLENRRERESIDKLFQRCIRDLADTPEEDRRDARWRDGKIWEMLIRFEHGERPFYSVMEGKDGQRILEGWNPVTEGTEIIPCYTTDLNAALALWPDEERPKQWDGSVRDCCVSALKARKARTKAMHAPRS